jgi:hypothetical protein
MSFERFTHSEGGDFPWLYEGWRCVQCGEVIDPLILHNRLLQQKKALVAETNVKETEDDFVGSNRN